MSDRDTLYLGRAGELHVISEFLARGYNVAVPEVDVGDDALVIVDRNHTVRRLQVKTSRLINGVAQFTLPRAQVEVPSEVQLWFVFLTRSEERWHTMLLISRSDLQDLQDQRQGTRRGSQLNFKVRFLNGRPCMGALSLDRFVEDWSRWPRISG